MPDRISNASLSQEKFLHDVPHIRRSLDYLLEKDPVFSKVDTDFSDFPWPHFSGGFTGLVRIVIGQQISTSAATALWNKMFTRINPLTPENLLKQNDATLRDIGLSRQKQSYVRGLAGAILDGEFDPSGFEDLADEDIRARITSLKGFGDWSANIYLLFCLARPDVWPAGDLGIQLGLQDYLELDEKPDAKRTAEEGERFKGHRSAASLLMWHLKSQK